MIKSLKEIPAGERVFIDANIFHLYFRGPEPIKKQCRAFIQRIATGEILGYTSVLVLDEFIYKILLKLIEIDYRKNPLVILRREKFSTVRKYSGIVRGLLGEILRIENLTILPVAKEDIMLVSEMLYEVGLLPRDAIHIAVMRRNNINALASVDPDFDAVEGIIRYSPITE